MVLLNRRDVLLSAAAGSVLALPASSLAQAPAAPNPKLVRLEPRNALIRAQIAPEAGGELVGLQLLIHGEPVELLYRGGDFSPARGWRGKAPVLWPGVGRNAVAGPGQQLSDAAAAGWLVDGKKFPMPMHGFVSSKPWSLGKTTTSADTASVVVSTSDSSETRSMYPFGYELEIEYRVQGGSIWLNHRVTAGKDNGRPMPFSIGNHLTFKTPFAPGGSVAATTLASSARRQVVVGPPQNLPTGQVIDNDFSKPRPIEQLGGGISTSITGGDTTRPWVRLEDPAGVALTVSHHADWLPEGAPVLFNLWGDPTQGYFAPEPWVGKQYSLARNDGVILLAPGRTFEWRVQIETALIGPLKRS